MKIFFKFCILAFSISASGNSQAEPKQEIKEVVFNEKGDDFQYLGIVTFDPTDDVSITLNCSGFFNQISYSIEVQFLQILHHINDPKRRYTKRYVQVFLDGQDLQNFGPTIRIHFDEAFINLSRTSDKPAQYDTELFPVTHHDRSATDFVFGNMVSDQKFLVEDGEKSKKLALPDEYIDFPTINVKCMTSMAKILRQIEHEKKKNP